MMNLEKMKQKKRTITKSRVKKSLLAATTFLCLTTPLLQTQTAYAAENTTPAITIEKPDGWKQGETTIAVTVDASHMPEGFSIAKIEAKAGKDGSWQDVTGSGSITITGNQTVYVRVTDGEGKVYEQNRSIKCYDTEKPTLSASLTDGVLTIQGNDTVSGITAVTVNGTTYTDLKDGMLRVQLTQKDFTTKQIEITVTDGAGNTSEKYVLQNPYYEWAKKQAEKQKSSRDSNGAMATTTSAECLYMDSLCSHHAEIQYLYLIHNVYNVIILPFHSCKKKREPFTALFHIDFLIHLSYSTVCQPMSLNFFPKMGQSLVLHQMPSQLLSFDHILLQIPMQIHSSKHLSE